MSTIQMVGKMVKTKNWKKIAETERFNQWEDKKHNVVTIEKFEVGLHQPRVIYKVKFNKYLLAEYHSREKAKEFAIKWMRKRTNM